MQVRDLMNPSVVSITPSESASLAARLLSRHNVGSLPVCGEDGGLRGRSGSPYLATRPQKPGYDGGTAPPGVAEYVNNGGKHHAICETCHSEC